VLEYGFAYGTNGTALKGKQFLCAITAGGGENAYKQEGFNHFTIRELLRPMEQTAFLTGMEYLAPFVLFGARNAVEENRVHEHVHQLHTLLNALSNNKLDIEQAKALPQLNKSLATLIQA
jgi:putative NADPH-quinone reductase